MLVGVMTCVECVSGEGGVIDGDVLHDRMACSVMEWFICCFTS